LTTSEKEKKATLAIIAGSGRSGTTWLGRIFDSHPWTMYLHEPDLVFYDSSFPVVPNPEELDALVPMVEEFLDMLKRSRPLKALASRPVFGKRYRSLGAQLMRNGIIFTMRGVEAIGGRAAQKIRIPDMIDSGSRPRITFVLKSVNALGRLPLYGTVRPEMPIIHIVRHPCGVVSSVLRGMKIGSMPEPQIFRPCLDLPTARRHNLTEGKVQRMSPLEKATWGWLILNEWAMERRPAKARWKLLRYEDLCANPLEESSKLFAWCGLSWAEETQAFLESNLRANDNATYFDVIRNPAASVNRWQQELALSQINQISEIVGGSLPGELYGMQGNPDQSMQV
jgi:hypothetical protein